MTVRPGVVVVSGHMVDTPDRQRPRFPPEQVPRVVNEVQTALERWNVGHGTTLITGGARGADIVAAEEALARGASLRLVLARRPEDFVKDSVALPGTEWEERFFALLGHATVEIVDGSETDVYTQTNNRIIAIARAIDDRPHAIIVWNGEAGDGPGGTSDFAERLSAASGDDRLIVIDPTP